MITYPRRWGSINSSPSDLVLAFLTYDLVLSVGCTRLTVKNRIQVLSHLSSWQTHQPRVTSHFLSWCRRQQRPTARRAATTSGGRVRYTRRTCRKDSVAGRVFLVCLLATRTKRSDFRRRTPIVSTWLGVRVDNVLTWRSVRKVSIIINAEIKYVAGRCEWSAIY